jgi:hypothetical protein
VEARSILADGDLSDVAASNLSSDDLVCKAIANLLGDEPV